MKTYDNYIDSNYHWIGPIPKHWDLFSLKRLIKYTKGKTPKVYYSELTDSRLPYLSMDYLRGNSNYTSYVAENDPNIYTVKDNDILLLWDGAKAGEFLRSKRGALASTVAKLHISELLDNEYTYFLLKVNEKYLQDNTTGMGIPHVESHTLNRLPCLCPPINEQKIIANYLDYKTNLIDSAITKKQLLINKLEEKRQSITNKAITKGLNPNVKLKDSGVKWIGDIPEQWDTLKLKYITECNVETLSDKEENDFNIKYIEIGSVSLNNGVEKYDTIPLSSAPTRARRIVRTNDIIISTVRTYLKAITQITKEYDGFIASTGFAVLSPKGVNSSFLGFSVSSDGFIDEIISKSVGVGYPAINTSELINIIIPVPTESEQIIIASYLDKKTNKIDNLTTKLKVQIDNLKEYRESIIFEAVTGKIDLRDWQQHD